MRCPFCGADDTFVIDSRDVEERNSTRRRRECTKCDKRFTTYERIDLADITVIKKNGLRESFDRSKILNGIIRACEKRPVSRDKMEEVTDKIERKIRAKGAREMGSKQIGDLVVRELYKLDPVAYIRFASVYHSFDSPAQFRKAVLMFEKSRKGKKQ